MRIIYEWKYNIIINLYKLINMNKMKINKINEKHLNFSCLSFKLLVGTITTDVRDYGSISNQR